MYRYFIVSPTYNGIGWYDPKARINFFKTGGVISVPIDSNFTYIDRYIKLNYLIEVNAEGQEISELVVQTPNQLLSEQDDANKEKPIEEESIEEELDFQSDDKADNAEKEIEKSEDNSYTFDSLNEKKYSDIRSIAKELDLKASGKKEEIIQRILDNQ